MLKNAKIIHVQQKKTNMDLANEKKAINRLGTICYNLEKSKVNTI